MFVAHQVGGTQEGDGVAARAVVREGRLGVHHLGAEVDAQRWPVALEQLLRGFEVGCQTRDPDPPSIKTLPM